MIRESRIKPGGPYKSLIEFEDEVMPLTFADILILRYLSGLVDEYQTLEDFNKINQNSQLQWSIRSHIAMFVRRFITDNPCERDREWMQQYVERYQIKISSRFKALNRIIPKD